MHAISREELRNCVRNCVKCQNDRVARNGLPGRSDIWQTSFDITANAPAIKFRTMQLFEQTITPLGHHEFLQ